MNNDLRPEHAAGRIPVPPLNDDLAVLLDDLRGFHAGLDRILDGARLIATDRLTIAQTQALAACLGGSTDGPGQQIDVLALIAALLQRLLNPDENPALRNLDADLQDQALEAGREFAAHDADFTPRHLIAKTIHAIQP